MSLFDKEKDKMLINLVRGKPVIYNSSHPQHRNLIAKHTEWKEISTAMDIPIPDIQKRWKHFRDHYKKKQKLKSKKITWRYMHLLEFLSAPSKLSQSENRSRVEEQHKALSQEPQTPELSDISIFSFEDLEDLQARSKTRLTESGTSIIPETISPTTRRPEDTQMLAGPSTSFHNDNIQKKQKPESESSFSFEALRERPITTDIIRPILSDQITKEDQNSSNSEDICVVYTQPIEEKISDSDIGIDGRYDTPTHTYFALIAEIATMFPPHLVSDLKLSIHRNIYRIELKWQREKREEEAREKKESEKREREERRNVNRRIAKSVFIKLRQLRALDN